MIRSLFVTVLFLATIPYFFAQSKPRTTSQSLPKNGAFTFLYPDGSLQEEGTVSGNTRSGTRYIYYQNGKLARKTEYSVNLPGGKQFAQYEARETVTCYRADGTVESVRKYINGADAPGNEAFYANGQVRSEMKPAGDGVHFIKTTYAENGRTLQYSEIRVDGRQHVRDGVFKEWTETGTLIADYTFADGKQKGIGRSWNKAGVLVAESLFENDKYTYLKKWSDDGQLLQSSAPEENIHVTLYSDVKTAKTKTYNITHTVDTLTIKLQYTDEYDKAGVLTKRNVVYKQPNVSENILYGIENSSAGTAYINYMGAIRINPGVKADSSIVLAHHYNAQSMGFVISNNVRFPLRPTERDIRKILGGELKKSKKQFTGPDSKAPAEYRFPRENLPAAEAYYREVIQRLFFTSATVVSDFDSSMTGDYTIYYTGTELRLKAHLDHGLLHGKATLFLGDSARLFENNYLLGMRHGTSTEWYINGNVATISNLRFGKLQDFTTYFLEGGKRAHKWPYDTKPDQEWYQSGKPKRFTVTEGTTVTEVEADEQGTILSYRVTDKTKGIYLYKIPYNGTLQTSTQGIEPATGVYQFSTEKYGIRLEGKAYYDTVQKTRVLEDNFGKNTFEDYNLVEFPANIPCDCREWEARPMWKPDLLKHSRKDQLRRYQLGFHKQLELEKLVNGNPYYINQRPDRFVFGREYNVYSYFTGHTELTLALPDSNGLILSLGPCRAKDAALHFEVGLTFRYGFPGSTHLSILKPKTLALRFNGNMLRQLDAQFEPVTDAAGNPVPGSFLFSGERLVYDKKKEVDIVEPRLACTAPVAITGTQLIVEPRLLMPDMSTTFNYPEMEQIWHLNGTAPDPRLALLGMKPALFDNFTGAYLPEAVVYLPVAAGDSTVYLPFEGKEIVIGKTFAAGTLTVPASKNNGSFTFAGSNDEPVVLSAAALEQLLKTSGLTRYTQQFDGKTSTLTLHFYYSIR